MNHLTRLILTVTFIVGFGLGYLVFRKPSITKVPSSTAYIAAPDVKESVKRVGEYDTEGRKTGQWISYYQSGSKKLEGHYIAGLREGDWYAYPHDGKYEDYWSGRYEKGKKTGDFILHENSKPIIVDTFQDGVKLTRTIVDK